jgi:hypothetical protein
MSYKTSTYTKPDASKKLLTFPTLSKYTTQPKQSYYCLSSSLKTTKKQLGMAVVTSPSKLSKSEHEEKIKKSMQTLKKSYANHLAKKHCSKLISIEDRPQIIMSFTQPESKKQNAKKKQTPKSKIICISTLKSGKPCTAPAKNGSKFCGRHG